MGRGVGMEKAPLAGLSCFPYIQPGFANSKVASPSNCLRVPGVEGVLLLYHLVLIELPKLWE